MKKIYKFTFTAICIGVILGTLCACGSVNEQKKLPTPTGLAVNGSTLVWDEMLDAESFKVDMNGREYVAPEASFTILSEYVQSGESRFELKVKAVGDGKYYSDSDWSESVTLDFPLYVMKPTADGNYYAISKCVSASGNIELPNAFNGTMVTEISAGAFKNCNGITGIEIPDTITTIAVGAFDNCDNLKYIKLPQYITSFGISNCKSLEQLEIPERVTSLNVTYCEKLTGINLPAGVTNIFPTFLNGCTGLTELTVDDGNIKFKSDGNCIIRKSGNALVKGCAGSKIPDYVKTIEGNAFNNSGLTEITIPSNVKSIGSDAFFYNKLLNKITIENGVESIGSGAFSGCGALSSLHFPSSVSTIGYLAFRNCDKLTELTVDENNPVLKSGGNCIISKEGNILHFGCNGSTIPDYVTEIGDYAFEECNALKGVVIPNGVTKLGEMCFYDCDELDYVAVPNSVVSIGNQAFDYNPLVHGWSYGDITISVTDNSNGQKDVFCRPTIPGTCNYIGRVFSVRNNCEIAYDDVYAYVVSASFKLALQETEDCKIVDAVGKVRGYPTRLGYTFGGYSATPGGTDAITTDEQLNAIVDQNGYVRVYPIWIKNQ